MLTKKRTNPLVIVRPLEDVPDQLVFKESYGKFHQFDQIVGNQRNVVPGRHMQQHPKVNTTHKHEIQRYN